LQLIIEDWLQWKGVGPIQNKSVTVRGPRRERTQTPKKQSLHVQRINQGAAEVG
jgi:hypothetical protein